MTSDKKFNPDELKQFLQNKYGSGVQVEIFPKTQQEQTDEINFLAGGLSGVNGQERHHDSVQAYTAGAHSGQFIIPR